MRTTLPERYRVTIQKDKFFGTSPFAKEGVFVIPHEKITDYNYHVIFSSGMGWEHASVTLHKKGKFVERCPTWGEMCYIKGLFFNEDEPAVQYHPAASDYVNNHPYCLHIWRPTELVLPVPDPIMIGIK